MLTRTPTSIQLWKMMQAQTNTDTRCPWLQYLSCDWVFSSGIRYSKGSAAIQSALYSTQSQPAVGQFGCDCILSRRMVFRSSLSKAKTCILGGNVLAFTGTWEEWLGSTNERSVFLLSRCCEGTCCYDWIKARAFKYAVINGMNQECIIEPHL